MPRRFAVQARGGHDRWPAKMRLTGSNAGVGQWRAVTTVVTGEGPVIKSPTAALESSSPAHGRIIWHLGNSGCARRHHFRQSRVCRQNCLPSPAVLLQNEGRAKRSSGHLAVSAAQQAALVAPGSSIGTSTSRRPASRRAVSAVRLSLRLRDSTGCVYGRRGYPGFCRCRLARSFPRRLNPRPTGAAAKQHANSRPCPHPAARPVSAAAAAGSRRRMPHPGGRPADPEFSPSRHGLTYCGSLLITEVEQYALR